MTAYEVDAPLVLSFKEKVLASGGVRAGGEASPAADQVGYRQHAVWLSRDELLAMISECRGAIAPRLANPPTPDRAQYLLSPILFPIEEPPADPEAD